MNLYLNPLYIDELNKETERKEVWWKQLRGKRVLITGASGMVGAYLIDLLMRRNELYGDKIEIYALSRSMKKLQKRFKQYVESDWIHLIEHDICNDLENKFHAPVDYMIHAASNTHPIEYFRDPVGTITTNVFGTYHLFEYARKHFCNSCRIVILSSVEIYGDNHGGTEYFTENDMGYLNCNTMRAAYPESKRISESLMQAYIHQYGIDAVCARLSRIYGPSLEEDDSKALTQFINNSVKGEDIVLKSSGDQRYSYTYIADAVRAVLTVMLKGKCGETYNVSDESSNARLKDIAGYLAEISGTEVVFHCPEESEAKGYSTAIKALLNSSKLKKELEWKSYYSIEEGLKKTVQMLSKELYNGQNFKEVMKCD